jgi:hypothetical protein
MVRVHVQNVAMGGNYSILPGNLKILVVGTPKTGNTWLKHVLADVYDLPIVRLGSVFDPKEADAAGSNWICHQHYLPKQSLLSWAKANHTLFVSVVRHPADVLISLWHHSKQARPSGKNLPGEAQGLSKLSAGVDINCATTVHFVQREFPTHLNLSIAWSSISGVATLRYEDLWNEPWEALSRLTEAIEPRSPETLKLSLCANEFGLLQSTIDPDKKLVRKGGTGGWVHILSPEIKRLLARSEPYPSQFASLGYTMDERDPANHPRPCPGRICGSFSTQPQFDDGTPITPVLMKAYHRLPSDLRERWSVPAATTPGSFFCWLNSPAAADPGQGPCYPIITELAHHIYKLRSDVQKVFPDPFGANRSEFCEWLFFDARREYKLPETLLRQNPFLNADHFSDGTPLARVLVRAYLDLPADLRQKWTNPAKAADGSYLSWLKSPARADPSAGDHGVIVTELGAYLHSTRADLSQLWPDLFGTHRVDFSDWFLSNAASEYRLDPTLIAPVASSWAKSFRTSASTFSDGTPIVPILKRAYLSLPKRLKDRWADPSADGADSFLSWLKSPAEADPAAGDRAPIVTELGAFLYSVRCDIRGLMPDLYGEHRVDFADWFVSSAAADYGLDQSLVTPVLLSWAQGPTGRNVPRSAPQDTLTLSAR